MLGLYGGGGLLGGCWLGSYSGWVWCAVGWVVGFCVVVGCLFWGFGGFGGLAVCSCLGLVGCYCGWFWGVVCVGVSGV